METPCQQQEILQVLRICLLYIEMVHLQFGQVEDYSVLVRLPVGLNEVALNIPFAVFPNPFEGTARIEYQLNANSKVTLEVYNVVGEKVQSFVTGEQQSAGKHSFNFEGAVSGIYTVRLTVDGQSIVQKIVKF